MTEQAKRLKALMRSALKEAGVEARSLQVRTEVSRRRDSVSGQIYREYGKANGFVKVPLEQAGKAVAAINARSPRARAYVLYETQHPGSAWAVVTAED